MALNPGVYKVTASMKGFQTAVQDNVQVTVDQVSTVNMALNVGNVSEVVTVTESTSLVEASNSTVGQLISAQTIDRVPLLTRNVFDLVQLSAGVTPANGAPNSSTSYAIINISSGRPGVDVSSYTINGAIVGSVYYMLDGSPLGVAEQNIAAIIPAMEIPEDGVEETRVETQNTPATYLSGGAGVISLASKSGGDKFHGDGFVVMRPNVLAANEWFNKQAGNPTPAYHRYQEGGAIGGPILHKKLFFFGDYEATQQQAFDGSSQFTVPTTAERTGDFSADSFAIYDPTLPDNPDGTRQQGGSNGGTLNKIANPNPIKPRTAALASTTSMFQAWTPRPSRSSTSAWTITRAKSSASLGASPLTGCLLQVSTLSITRGIWTMPKTLPTGAISSLATITPSAPQRCCSCATHSRAIMRTRAAILARPQSITLPLWDLPRLLPRMKSTRPFPT